MLQFNRQLIIATAGSRDSLSWPASRIWWSELIDRLRTPVRSNETLAEYLAMEKKDQDALKDVGGFVGGMLAGNRRRSGAVLGRDIIALDLDAIPANGTNDALLRLESLGCAYVVYSTRKHRPEAPRLRALILLDRTVTADEYEAIARKIASFIGINLCDPTTFQPHRLMYWPSCCSDSEYVYYYADRAFAAADGILRMYTDWKDMSQWPQVPGAYNHRAMATKQGDPTTKPGIAGAFCRRYNVLTAMEAYLPGLYTPTDDPARYTYSQGSTAGGAIIYDDGTFLYSHHATDPCSGKLVNAFDLVRLHKFADLDDAATSDTPVGRMPSYTAMRKLAVEDPAVTAILNQDRYEAAVEEFKRPAETSVAPEAETDWMSRLSVHARTGLPEKTINNVKTIVQNDPLLKDRIRLDTFADAYKGQGPLPWELRRQTSGIFDWTDRDDRGLRCYIETVYGIRGKDLVDDGLGEAAAALAYDPVRQYLDACVWDGVSRLDTLYIDFLGAEDCEYTRAVTRKAFVAAVARAYAPGTKFDTMTVVCGPQGIGKSTLFSRMGLSWFTSAIRSFENKTASELLQGIWICEIEEMEAFDRSDVKAVKAFITKLEDHYRAAYARKTEKHPRRCVFFGTTNDHSYLKDPTGNRRFWPVDAAITKPSLSAFRELTPAAVAQIWAEAIMRYQLGEPLILPDHLEEEADRRREEHFDTDPLQGQIEEFLGREIPEDWSKWDQSRRSMYWATGPTEGMKLIARDRTCAAEIWRECLGNRAAIPKAEGHRINRILEKTRGWERASTIKMGGGYGTQKGFRRVETSKPSLVMVNQVNYTQKMEVNQVNHEKVDSLPFGLRLTP